MSRRLPVSLFAVALAIVAAAAPALAWGPASHYFFTCEARGVRAEDCLTSAHADLLSGTELPDAFGFGALLSPIGGAVSPCSDWQFLGLHSPVFAGYLYKNAANYSTATFNATEFAIGFGMHVSADAAGFYDKGYLGYGWGHNYQGKTNSSTSANWLALWPFMESVDAFVYHSRFRQTNLSLPLYSVPSASDETAAFVAATVEVANADTAGAFPAANASTISTCAAMWQSILSEESIKVMQTPREVFGWEMVYNDRYGAHNMTEAVEHFGTVAKCAIEAARTWHRAIAEPKSTPMSALQAMFGYVQSSYAAGKCSPTAAPPTQREDEP